MRQIFDKIALYFGKDLGFSRWLKAHGNKPVESIVSSMNEEELKEALEFMNKRPTEEIYNPFSNEYTYPFIDHRVEYCWQMIRNRLRWFDEDKYRAKIKAIDWSAVKLSDLQLVVQDVPEYQEETSIDWHRKGMVTIKQHFSLALSLNVGGEKFKIDGHINLTPKEGYFSPWGSKELWPQKNIYKPIPNNWLEVVRKKLENDPSISYHEETMIGDYMRVILGAFAYNWCVDQRLAKEKGEAAERIKNERLKEKMRYRLKHSYGK